MEYRMRYRDVPWGVAVGCLFGKIGYTLTFRPLRWIEKNWGRILWKIGKLSVLLILITVIVFSLLVLVDKLLDHALFTDIGKLFPFAQPFLDAFNTPEVAEVPPEL